ncbi:Pterin-4-alpha-carbinolamine dehydratase-like protein [Emericellopsis cladophorae]|uniref:4a-hydroxytetrahydrobiopterin dehydratase n=1 Tax=Emericellopsis cladophorae TaxID=2686198 RepID=A0A9Q0BFX4_9HYPO|nr:Pterin-4-alpha-carbinolamine dehydratase-like protein [Emericellopsis cladophorae]KAI6783381.1 Pterin-4-alpha-carbinolamine dehydratase-like protein [Emericellopsis cladophorae]
MATKARFSDGTNEATATPALNALLSKHWTLAKEGEALERSFKFKTFSKTWCKIKNHHPEWSNVYNTTFIRWTTHNPKGLSDKDLDLATKCDAIAAELGELAPEPPSCEIRDVADKATTSAGDCCIPKK